MGWVDWLDERLGIRAIPAALRRELERPLPSGVNYFHTLGAVAAVLLVVLAATGLLLALNYTPSMDGAHASVRRITQEFPGGWMIRSLHYWSANLLVGVLIVHLLTAFAVGAYKKPRELTWVSGAVMLLLTLAFCLTGYLLPMEQLSYWATTVVTDVLRGLPLVEDGLARAVRGGDEISDATLGRFFMAHVWILPLGAALFAGLHFFLVHRLGITPRAPVGRETLSPDESTTFGKFLHKDAMAATAALCLIVLLAGFWPRSVEPTFDRLRTERGTRPEWYFLPAYQALKYFPKLVGLLVVNLGALLVLLLPWIDRSPEREWRKRKRVLVWGALILLMVAAIGGLGYVSDRTFVIFGAAIQFDELGFPR